MADKETWTLYYHGGLAGRAEFVRLIFEEVGESYINVGDPDVMAKIRGGNLENSFPAFAPPIIRKGDFTLAQTPVICKYLGKRFELWPECDDDVWHAEQINATVHDYILEGCMAYHGKHFTASYYDQVEETQPYIDWFLAERLEKWLKNFEKYLQANDGGKGYVVGKKLTYVDLAVLHAIRVTAFQFKDRWENMECIPLLKAFKDRMESRPNLAAYFKSDRCIPFSGVSMM